MDDIIIKISLFIGALVGFIIGVLYYKKYGWKPKEPTDTDLDFIEVSTLLFGFIGMVTGIFIFLGITVFFIIL